MTAHRVYRGAGLRRRPAGGRRRWIAAAALLGVFGTYVTVMQTSQAAFTATTANPTNSWASGTVSLADDDTGSAMFTVTNLKPGGTGVRCIVVTYNGSLAASIKMYGTTSSNATLANYLTITVEQGSGSTYAASSGGTCTGFVSSSTIVASTTLVSFGTTYTNFSTGAGSWLPVASAPGATTVYRITYTLPSGTTDSAQNLTSTATFTWEAQNT